MTYCCLFSSNQTYGAQVHAKVTKKTQKEQLPFRTSVENISTTNKKCFTDCSPQPCLHSCEPRPADVNSAQLMTCSCEGTQVSLSSSAQVTRGEADDQERGNVYTTFCPLTADSLFYLHLFLTAPIIYLFSLSLFILTSFCVVFPSACLLLLSSSLATLLDMIEKERCCGSGELSF